ncbi:hypothetical protein BH11MYX1_BH11MYX1_28370 [soil metagenome]
MKRAAVVFAFVALASACRSEENLGTVPGILFGANVVPSGSDRNAAFVAVEQEIGRSFDLDRIFHQGLANLPGDREAWTIGCGRTPVVSFNTVGSYTWGQVASGKADAQLQQVADGFRALVTPVFAIYVQDPDASTQSENAVADFAPAYRHVVEVFRARNASNVQWIFNLKSTSYKVMGDAYYPGDDYIDWLGVSAYNYGSGGTQKQVQLDELLAEFIAWSGPHGKPLFITEWSSGQDDGTNAGRYSKAEWIVEARTYVEHTPEIRAMTAFWGSAADADRFDTSPAALAAFTAFGSDAYTQLRTLKSGCN